MSASAPTLVTPYGYSSSSCGYCTPSGSRSSTASSKKYGMSTSQMTCQFYQDLIDRGWRRSGNYVYQPDMARTCCPQYTIRLDAEAFKPSKKHRQVVNRFNRYLEEGAKPGEGSTSGQSASSAGMSAFGHGASRKGKGKAQAGEWSFETELKKHEEDYGVAGKHRYDTQLFTSSEADDESFQLYKKYQIAVHKDIPQEVTLSGFRRFLCNSPLRTSPIKYLPDAYTSQLPESYGSYHLRYRIDGKLVGISAIDILPSCVSSVYFIWDPDYAWASLGKLSALREIALAREIRTAGAESMRYVYMGYWIPGCGKMVYKSEYSPSYLLEPDTHDFHLLGPKLDRFLRSHPRGYFPFPAIEAGLFDDFPASEQAADTDGDGDDDIDMDIEKVDDFPDGHTPGWADPETISNGEVEDLLVVISRGGLFKRKTMLSIGDLSFGSPADVYEEIRHFAAAVGMDLMGKKGISKDELEHKAIISF